MAYYGQLEDLQFLENNAASLKVAGLHAPHLDQRINLLNYVRIADHAMTSMFDGITRSEIPASGARRLLDWGCGYGQMTWLLKRRGLTVTSFDIGAENSTLPNILLSSDLQVQRSTHPTELPYPDNSFDGVLSCGVLEHVDECSGVQGNELKSLREIARVLATDGKFLIYQLPQKAAWQEAIVRRLGLGYAHPRRYSKVEIIDILEGAGFHVKSVRRANFIPKNLTGLPMIVRRIYSKFSSSLMLLDRFFCRLPFINRIAGVLEIVAVKK